MITLRVGSSEFEHEVANIVDKVILEVDIVCTYGFLFDFENNILRIEQGEAIVFYTARVIL